MNGQHTVQPAPTAEPLHNAIAQDPLPTCTVMLRNQHQELRGKVSIRIVTEYQTHQRGFATESSWVW